MTKFVISLLAGFLCTISTLSLAGTAETEQAERRQQIHVAVSSEPYKLYAGYPICQDVMDRRLVENRMLIERTADSLIAARFSEMTSSLPSEEFKMAQRKLGDAPEFPVAHWRRRPVSSGCFVFDTPIVTLVEDKDVPNKFSKEVTTIKLVYVGDMVLSSTAAMFENDQSYKKDCWAKVQEVYQGEIPHEKSTTLIEYETSKHVKFTVEATHGHRIYAFNEEYGAWDWVKASDLTKGMGLLSDCDSDLCKILKVEPKTYRYGWWVRNIFSDMRQQVFNLATDTFTFYVGPEDGRFLVHNVW